LSQNEINFSSESLGYLIQDTLSKGASFRFQAKGSSMSPFIKDGDIVVISPSSNSAMSFGKPVAFVRTISEKLVIHRIIGHNRNGFVVKGDSVLGIDGLIPMANILGVVTAIERNGKPIRLGLGSERILIALLSRFNLLPTCSRLWMFIPPAPRGFIKHIILS